MQEAPTQPQTIEKPFWQQKTFWASVVSVVLALPTFVEQVAPFLDDEQRQKAMALSALAAAVAAIFARMGGVAAAKVASEQVVDAQIGTLSPGAKSVIADAVADKIKKAL